MRQFFLPAAAVFAALSLTAPVAAAGNFEFVVPGEPGLTLSVSGYRADGSEIFRESSGRLETRDGKGVYIVRIDETLLKDGRLSRWCAEDVSGAWSALAGHNGATAVCDDKPSETRGSYLFKPGSALAAAVPAEATPALPAMSVAEAATCVQSGSIPSATMPGPPTARWASGR